MPVRLEHESAPWVCDRCGLRLVSDISVYDETASRFNEHCLRFGPWCTTCKARVRLRQDGTLGDARIEVDGPVVVLISGTCASGKSRISYELASTHGFVQIDGDWVWTMLKAESGKKLPSDAIHRDLMDMAYGMHLSGRNSSVAHVVRPHEFGGYEQYMGQRGVPLLEVVLQPTEAVAIARSVERRCWPKPTPEYWVRFFRDEFAEWKDRGNVRILDNSDAKPENTAAAIVALTNRCASQSRAT